MLVFILTRRWIFNPPRLSLRPFLHPHPCVFSSCLAPEGSLGTSIAVGTGVSCPFPWDSSFSGSPSFGALVHGNREGIWQRGFLTSSDDQSPSFLGLLRDIFPYPYALLPVTFQAHSSPCS